MINNADYLIQKYAEAREQMNSANIDAHSAYWRGTMDTYHSILCATFDNWAAQGSTGYYVFYQGMTYDKALDQTVGRLVDC